MTWNWAKKLIFWLIKRFFHYALLCPPSYTPIFSQVKGLMVIHNRGKFHHHVICGSKVINFQMFSWRCSIHEMVPSWGFFGLFLPQIWLKFVEIWTRGSLSQDKYIAWTIFQNWVFKHKRDVPKVYSYGPFLGPIYPQKTKNVAKNQNFPRNYILRNIKWLKSQIPDKSQNSYKKY